MVLPRYRSRTYRRVFVRSPKGKSYIQYRRRKPAKAQCAGCGVFLQAVPQKLSSALKRMAKTTKRPERPYGGMYCSACTRKLMKARARSI